MRIGHSELFNGQAELFNGHAKLFHGNAVLFKGTVFMHDCFADRLCETTYVRNCFADRLCGSCRGPVASSPIVGGSDALLGPFHKTVAGLVV